MATIEARKTSDGKTTYRVKIRIRGFPSQSATFERKTDAKNWAAQTESAIREGRYFKNNAAKKYTVGDLIARYLEHQENRNQKRVLDVRYYLKWWDQEIGMYLLSDLTKNLILTKREQLIQSGIYVKKRAPATVNRYMGVLSHALSVAVNEWEWLPEHPMKNIAKLPEPRGRVRFLDEDERTRLLDACRESSSAFLYPLVVLALSTGARHGELISLRWDQVDFERKAIVLHNTKNGERRVLALAHHALEVMEGWYRARDPENPLVFPSERYPAQPVQSRPAWLEAIKQAGCPPSAPMGPKLVLEQERV